MIRFGCPACGFVPTLTRYAFQPSATLGMKCGGCGVLLRYPVSSWITELIAYFWVAVFLAALPFGALLAWLFDLPFLWMAAAAIVAISIAIAYTEAAYVLARYPPIVD